MKFELCNCSANGYSYSLRHTVKHYELKVFDWTLSIYQPNEQKSSWKLEIIGEYFLTVRVYSSYDEAHEGALKFIRDNVDKLEETLSALKELLQT